MSVLVFLSSPKPPASPTVALVLKAARSLGIITCECNLYKRKNTRTGKCFALVITSSYKLFPSRKALNSLASYIIVLNPLYVLSMSYFY